MADTTMSMSNASTVKDFISNFNTEELISSAFFLKQVFSNSSNRKMIINFENLVLKYMPELKDLKTKVKLSNQEYAKYKYNPKVLSYDLYGTTELWFLILEANELHSITEFNSDTVYLFSPDIVEKITRILNLEIDTKNYNEEEIASDLIN